MQQEPAEATTGEKTQEAKLNLGGLFHKSLTIFIIALYNGNYKYSMVNLKAIKGYGVFIKLDKFDLS